MRQHQSKIKRELICKRPSAGYSHSIMSRYKQLSEKRWFKIAFDIAKAWISNSIVGLRLNNSMNLRWEPICHSILNIFAAIAIQSMAFHKIILLVVVILNIKHSFSPAFKSQIDLVCPAATLLLMPKPVHKIGIQEEPKWKINLKNELLRQTISPICPVLKSYT